MKTITDHELSEIANDWAKEIPYENIGIRSAFAAGYRLAEQQANNTESKDGELPIQIVSGSLPYFRDVIEARIKYFNVNYHTYEGSELQNALDTIRRLVPPILFQIGN